MQAAVQEVDRVEILTLQDNYIDLVARDNNEVVSRAMPLDGVELKKSIGAEHGFSSLISVTKGEITRRMLLDFGFSPDGAAKNARALNADLASVEIMALSHGHLDHSGGLAELTKLVGRPGVQLVVHPSVFRSPRYLKVTEELKIFFPPFNREILESAGVTVVESVDPYPLLDGWGLFLGEIPRVTDFELGAPSLFYQEEGREIQDTFEDDTAVVFNVAGQGLVVLSGCAHSGIVNTTLYARQVTGVDKVLAVMGGFHLTGPDQEPKIAPTTSALKDLAPKWVIPTHCTGRKAVQTIEQELGNSFLLNMSGTTMTFAA